MEYIRRLWRNLTITKALEDSSGKLELLFFESIYRVTYAAGISSRDDQFRYTIYSRIVKLTSLLLVIGEVWYAFTATTSIDEIAGCINVTVIQLIFLYRYKNVMEHKDSYRSLAATMQSPYFDISTKTRQHLVEYWAKRNEKYLKLLLALGTCTLVVWNTYPLVDEFEYNLTAGVSLPFNYHSRVMYPIAYVLVAIPLTYMGYGVMTTDLIMQAHLMHLLCQYTVLGDCFRNMVIDCRVGLEDIHVNYLMYNKKFVTRYLKRLGNLVEQHKLILSHTMNLRNSVSRPMLGQLAASGTLICFLAYQATMTITSTFAKGLMSFLFLGYNLFEFYIICKWCEEITIESQKIGEAIYSSGWESGMSILPGVRSTVMLAIARTNRPVVFTAGGMYNLSLPSYSALVKTSYSALTVLLRFES